MCGARALRAVGAFKMQFLTTRETQREELGLLKIFDLFCRRQGLKYSLAGGTLLGAVRHGGFIPWDDDIDVCMPRPDYERFLDTFTPPQSNIILDDGRGKHAEYPFAKLMNASVVATGGGLAGERKLWIDIFPVDGYPEDDAEAGKLFAEAEKYRVILMYSHFGSYEEYPWKHGRLGYILRKAYAALFTPRRAIARLNALAAKYPYSPSPSVGNIVWGLHGAGERMKKEEFESLDEVTFEDGAFFAMSCRDSYLKGCYGDYMTLPPEDKRQTHGIKTYRV